MDPIKYLFNLFDKTGYLSSIVSFTQSNGSGGSKSPLASRNGSVTPNGAAAEGSKPPILSKTRSHVPDEAEMRKVFERFDENKDGVICSDELSRFMKRLGFEMSDDDVQILVKTVDENSKGTVNFSEFYALYSSLSGGDSAHSADEKAHEEEHEQNLKQAFKVFDKDGDGFISVLELQSVLLSLGMQEGRSLKKCEQMIKGVDADGNGKVCFKEFKKLMSSNAFQS
jgi:calcium-binding protein CML